MTANDSLERRIADHYAAEAPQRAPDWLLASTLDTIDTTPQRRVLIRVPWRIPTMNTFARVAIAAVILIAVGAVGLSVLRPSTSSGVGGPPIVSPSISPSPTPSASPSASPVSPPALTGTYTSDRNGFTISYPAGWLTRPATDPWTTVFPTFASTDSDVIYDPDLQDHLFLMVASQPLGGNTEAQWVDDLLTGLASAGDCTPPMKPVTIDGIQGQLCAPGLAAVSAGDRGYVIAMYTSGDDPAAVAAYDQAYFEEILATVQLQPENAADSAPSASP
jgi:hypothetical protein